MGVDLFGDGGALVSIGMAVLLDSRKELRVAACGTHLRDAAKLYPLSRVGPSARFRKPRGP
jgi:hypothetical protein